MKNVPILKHTLHLHLLVGVGGRAVSTPDFTEQASERTNVQVYLGAKDSHRKIGTVPIALTQYPQQLTEATSAVPVNNCLCAAKSCGRM